MKKRHYRVSALCHPTREHYARRMCAACYKRWQVSKLPKKDKDKILKRIKKWQKANPELRKKAISNNHKKLKRLAFEHYGLECFCCGEKYFFHLSMDHINGGGHKHRQSVGNIYQWLRNKNYPKGFRTLCFQCNCTRGFYGSCNPKHKNAHLP